MTSRKRQSASAMILIIIAYDEDGKPTKFRYSSREEMLDALFSDKGVPSCFKDKISELLGLSQS
jgi:acyl-CoA hydrolase